MIRRAVQRSLVLSVLLYGLAVTPAFSQETAKARVAVMNFENNSTWAL